VSPTREWMFPTSVPSQARPLVDNVSNDKSCAPAALVPIPVLALCRLRLDVVITDHNELIIVHNTVARLSPTLASTLPIPAALRPGIVAISSSVRRGPTADARGSDAAAHVFDCAST
jgi:hypothetical protein